MRFYSENGEPLQVSWNRKIRDSSDMFIPKSMGFGQPLLGVLESTDILRWAHESAPLKSVWYTTIWNSPRTTDIIIQLCISTFIWVQISIRYLDNAWDWIMQSILSQNSDRSPYIVVAADVARVYIPCLNWIFEGARKILD